MELRNKVKIMHLLHLKTCNVEDGAINQKPFKVRIGNNVTLSETM